MDFKNPFSKTVLLALLFVTCALLPAAGAVSMIGKAYCDNCWDGRFTEGEDYGLNYKNFNSTCRIKKGSSTITAFFKGRTDVNGDIKVNLISMSDMLGSSNVNTAFNLALFNGGDFRKGRMPDSSLEGCYLLLKCSICNLNHLNNGVCGQGVGNGWTTNVQIVPSSDPASADLKFDSLCYGPPVRNEEVCTSPGGTGDPHYTGADGSRFDFSGEPNASYCLVSDSHIHINVFYDGYRNAVASKAYTWIRQMAILWGHHTVQFQAREGARWQYDQGYMGKVVVDGEEVIFSQVGESKRFMDGQVHIEWLAGRRPSADDLVDVYLLKIGDLLTLRMTLRPEIAALRTKEDGLVHIDFQMPVVDVSDSAHGILGQTFRSDHQDRLAKQKLEYSPILRTDVVPGDNAEGFLDGSVSDYRSSAVLRTDCRVSRFTRATSRDSETARAVELASASGMSFSGGMSGGETDASSWKTSVNAA